MPKQETITIMKTASVGPTMLSAATLTAAMVKACQLGKKPPREDIGADYLRSPVDFVAAKDLVDNLLEPEMDAPAPQPGGQQSRKPRNRHERRKAETLALRGTK